MRIDHSHKPDKPSKLLLRGVKRLRRVEIPQLSLHPDAETLRGRVSSSGTDPSHEGFLRRKFK